jgi:hypothetical protein
MNPTRQQIVRNEPDYEDTRNPKLEMEELFSAYLASKPAESKNRKTAELEVRFQGIGGQPLSKIDYDNIIQHLYAAGFTTPNPDGTNILRIQPEYVDSRKGVTKLSNVRAEVVGVDLIQEYCSTNSIQHLLHLPSTMSARADKVQFTQKTPIRKTEDPNSEIWRPVDFRDHNFRIGYQNEQIYGPNGELVRGMIESKKWADSKKVFRHLNRVRFTHPSLPVNADITIVRSSAKSGKVMIPHYTIQEAKVFDEPESYEMELEVDNFAVGPGTKYDTLPKLLESVRAAIRLVLSAIQGTNYPIANTEMRQVQHAYLRMVKGIDKGENSQYDMQTHRVSGSDFIGPSSRTLQIEHIVAGENSTTILENYTVTDKADGERKMLYVADGGKLYWIDSTMRVQFTGAMTNEKKLYGSLFDGEHIKYDKKRKFINLYAVFDMYFIHRKSIRELAFVKNGQEQAQENKESDEAAKKPMYRWNIMNTAIQLLKPVSITSSKKSKEDESECPFRVQCKEFHVADSGKTIFQSCSAILSRIDDGLFEYETDGLIFTPANYGVGGNAKTAVGPLRKFTWEESFKWKPAEFNTVDFLVRIQKDNTGKDKVFTDYKDGTQFADQGVLQYKQLILYCGFDEKKHGFLNPFQQLIDGDFKRGEDVESDEPTNTYMAKPFIPSNPYDDKAFLCNVELKKTGMSVWNMETEEGDIFDENMIVEFRYDLSKVGGWRWIPLRVRYDKTSQMRQKGARVFGNDYTTANSNWYSIHFPVTKHMISTGQDIPESSSVGEDVYYNRKGSGQTTTRGLRDFHNLYVKSKLIAGAASRKDSLIDFSVGKAGDLAKWRYANLGFVLGIDVSKDNIVNKVDGACARYLNEAAKQRGLFGALFLVGNSSNNIRNGDAFASFKEKRIVQAVFGEGAKNQQELGAGIYKYYGVASEGFNVASCQFSLHYFFENAKTLHNFVRNVAECTKVGGTFVGTCWDGKTVFRLLKDRAEGDAFTIMRDSRKMFQLTKMYDETGFPEDEMSLGYGVSVYQESIGQAIVEYLVNFDFLVRVMENYGFVLADKEDTAKMGLPGGTGMFETLYYEMEQEVKRSPELKRRYGDALYMTEEEKTVSFLNRYFVFKKVRNVATERVTQLLEQGPESEGEVEETVEKITKKMNKRQKLATKAPKEPKAAKDLKEPKAAKDLKEPKEKRGFIRPIKKATQIVQMKISVYDPVEDTPIEMVKPREAEEVEEVVLDNPPEEGPAIVLAPPKAKRAVIRKPKLAKV